MFESKEEARIAYSHVPELFNVICPAEWIFGHIFVAALALGGRLGVLQAHPVRERVFVGLFEVRRHFVGVVTF